MRVDRVGFAILLLYSILPDCISPARALGQAPVPLAAADPYVLTDAPNSGYQPLMTAPLASVDARDLRWTFDLILGLPTGVRAARAVGDPEFGLLIEGFAGVDLIFPTVGAGIRKRFVPHCSNSDSLVISPGLDAYLLYYGYFDYGGWFGGGPQTIKLVTADVEIAWQHVLRPGVAGEFGVKIGGGPGYGNQWGFVVFGVFFGCRF